jgi:outer membrane protein assembly factor BamB
MKAQASGYAIDMGNNRRTGVYEAPAIGAGSEAWSFGSKRGFVATPVATGGAVYAAGLDKSVVALDAASGAPRWTFKTRGPVRSSPTVADGVVYVGGDDGIFRALDAATGSERWSSKVGGRIRSSAAVAGARVYFWSKVSVSPEEEDAGEEADEESEDEDDVLVALSAKTGALLWKKEVYGYTAPRIDPAVEGDTVYVSGVADGHNGERMYAFDGKSGKKRWSHSALLLGTSVVLTDNAVVAATEDGLTFVDREKGKRESRIPAGTGIGGAAWKDRFFVAYIDDDGAFTLAAFDKGSKRSAWTFEPGWARVPQTFEAYAYHPPVIAGGTLYWASNKTVYALDPAQGKVLWERALRAAVTSGIFAAGGSLYLASSKAIVALR